VVDNDNFSIAIIAIDAISGLRSPKFIKMPKKMNVNAAYYICNDLKLLGEV
jgi:hypothetical protein